MKTRKAVIGALVGLVLVDFITPGIPLGSIFLLVAVSARYKPLQEWINTGING